MPWDQMGSSDMRDWPLGRLLSAAARRVEREWNSHLSHWDLNHASLPVLVHLMARPRSQRELANACGVTEQTMSRILARMQRNGHITRTAHASDKRRHVIAVTEAGRAAVAVAADPVPAEEMTTRGLSPEQIDQLRELLAIVATATADDALGARDGRAGAGPNGSSATLPDRGRAQD
ncbi:MarR family winged helix-turn-helix transcriptional regulator [Cellulomonas chengniuliangii]|uniref:MarR family winged helix-turn-helix transcriptional regulator n=2 Tax=Cellulomonas chengniuliangii TaxID=2968084 RepID=A0ABY5L183_9CELL|nr:MarR family winged helix-turn-helix transcriptional regulator [Cellulomonas chengniuliangii]MCC2308141.1 MarR family winged helix-turn-helix transcriptional regulator [Cellulomonas chengniuliangii]UUI76535.1 MarR family winged helix-turn-helix transcriptional regulator [Cellulomonas chengniuliangii]